MPKFKPGHSPDGTPRHPKTPSVPPKKHGPDGTPIPQPHPAEGRHWIPESHGTEWDGTPWTIPGHWSDSPKPQPVLPPFKDTHRCKMDGTFIILGGYIRIYDNEVPSGQRGHELYLKFGGLGVGGMDGGGTLNIKLSSWSEFYNKISSFAYLAAAPSIEVPSSKLAHTVIVFYDSNSHIIGYAIPDVSADIGMAGGTVIVKS